MPDVWSVGHPITDTYLTIAFTKMAISRMFLPPPAFFFADAHGDVRMIGYVQVEMCEWSGYNVRVNMECASTVMCHVRVVRS